MVRRLSKPSWSILRTQLGYLGGGLPPEKKENRHNYYNFTDDAQKIIQEANEKLNYSSNLLQKLQTELLKVLKPKNEEISERKLRSIVERIPIDRFADFDVVTNMLQDAMELAAKQISKNWDSDRYVRE